MFKECNGGGLYICGVGGGLFGGDNGFFGRGVGVFLVCGVVLNLLWIEDVLLNFLDIFLFRMLWGVGIGSWLELIGCFLLVVVILYDFLILWLVFVML